MKDKGFDPVTYDIPHKDVDNPASIEHLYILSSGEKILATMFTAQGKGPHPVAIILHGFPGHDKNLDIAHTLRRGGISTVVFHYRGSWGSGGYIDFSNMLEDTGNVIQYLRDNRKELNVDPDGIILVGHSMGGWAALMTASMDDGIKLICGISAFNLGLVSEHIKGDKIAEKMVKETLKELSIPLKIRSLDHLIDQIMEHDQEWNLTGYAERFSGRSILLFGATKDQLSIPGIHLYPLAAQFGNIADCNLTVHMCDTDHSYSDSRIELQNVLSNWIEQRIRHQDRE